MTVEGLVLMRPLPPVPRCRLLVLSGFRPKWRITADLASGMWLEFHFGLVVDPFDCESEEALEVGDERVDVCSRQ